MSLRPGETLGTYRVVRRIGAGGTAEVFEVEHTALGTKHALKVLLPQWVESAEIRGRFLQEGRLQAEFRHPGLVRVTDTVAEPGIAGLVMDLLVGESVRDRLEREGYVAPQEAVEWVTAALDAIAEAHGRGVIHRDLKPENLFLEKTPAGERLRVIDFGIAKGPNAQRTTSRGALGTVAYMSPEQVRDPARVDLRTDVFALGAVLWELLVGRPAFEGETPFESMQRVISHDPGPPGAKRAGIPGWLDDIVQVAVRKEPSARFQSAAAFGEALRAGARGVTLPEAAPAGPGPERRARTSDGIGVFAVWVVGILAASLVVGVGVIAAVVGVGVFLRPPEIHSLNVTSDPCGVVTIDVDARSRGGDLEVIVNNGAPVLYPIAGRQTIQHTEALAPGSSAFVEVRLGSAYDSQSHAVNGQPPGVALQLPTTRSEGSIGRTLVRFEGTCPPPGLSWEARIDGVVTQGPVPANQELWLDTTGLKEGNHTLEVQVIDQGRTVDVETTGLTVGPPPPPGDLDLDGHLSRSAGGRDCDDTNPAVNPDAPEQSVPNGIDDNCDGRIDEGTIAYDDDGDGLSELQGDCNDHDPRVRPGAIELADCRDQDCDGEVDEGVTLPQREDLYEPNDTEQGAYDLKTRSKRAFSENLTIVTSSRSDEAYFRFYSQDGDFDDWGIDATVTALPFDSAYTLEVLDASGASRGTARIEAEGDMVKVRGRWLRDDGGDYVLRVRPERVPREWCPVTIELVSR
ncbi:MAG: protein kinase [Myxococcota bacterium]